MNAPDRAEADPLVAASPRLAGTRAPAPSGGDRLVSPLHAPLEILPPEEEFRAHVLARTETLAKLGAAAGVPARSGEAATSGSGAARLELYAEALELGLAHLKEARPG